MKKVVLKSILLALPLSVCIEGRALAQTINLEDFESGSIRMADPNEPDPNYRYLWRHHTGCTLQGAQCIGTLSIDNSQRHDGIYSLRARVTSNRAYIYFYPVNGDWQFTRKYILPAQTWQPNKYNRMRLWIKVPPGTEFATGGGQNFNIGTFVRCSTCGGNEDGGGHFYHNFNIPYTGEWHQIIFDTHPTASRTGGPCYGPNGHNDDCGDRLHTTGESNFNYFDLLTGWYLDFYGNAQSPLPSYPADYYVDGFEFYQETRPENIELVYSLNGVYVPSSNKIYVDWNRNKYDSSVNHEVRYAFQDIHQTGWNAATPAPNGVVAPLGRSAYNDMNWSTIAINVSGHSVIYIAIKPENSSLFRQIAIPVSGLAPPASLAPPTNLKIIGQ